MDGWVNAWLNGWVAGLGDGLSMMPLRTADGKSHGECELLVVMGEVVRRGLTQEPGSPA